jgi:hypothetical protein
MPLVLGYFAPRKRQPLECLCVEHGAARPTFRIPKRHLHTGLLPMLIAAEALHSGAEMPPVTHMPVEWTS